MIKETYKTINKFRYINWGILPFNDDLEMSWCHVFTIFKGQQYQRQKWSKIEWIMLEKDPILGNSLVYVIW